MLAFNREVGVFEQEIAGFNRRSLGMEDLEAACRIQGLILLVEPFPCQGLYFHRKGVPVVTVNRRLDYNSILFTGFWAVFLHCLRPGGIQVFEAEPDWDDRILLLSANLASVALIPNSRLWESLAVYSPSGPLSVLVKRLINSRIRLLLGGEDFLSAEQAL